MAPPLLPIEPFSFFRLTPRFDAAFASCARCRRLQRRIALRCFRFALIAPPAAVFAADYFRFFCRHGNADFHAEYAISPMPPADFLPRRQIAAAALPMLQADFAASFARCRRRHGRREPLLQLSRQRRRRCRRRQLLSISPLPTPAFQQPLPPAPMLRRRMSCCFRHAASHASISAAMPLLTFSAPFSFSRHAIFDCRFHSPTQPYIADEITIDTGFRPHCQPRLRWMPPPVSIH